MNKEELLDQEWGRKITQLLIEAYRWGYTLSELEDLIRYRMQKAYRMAEEVKLQN